MNPTGRMRRRYRGEGSTSAIPTRTDLTKEADRLLKDVRTDADYYLTDSQLARQASHEVFGVNFDKVAAA